MFNLESKIQDWKQGVRQAESVTLENVDELEEHLRESIGSFVEKGLSEEEAFLVASTRLGANSSLSQEYGKINGTTVWRRRFVWMLFGYLGITALVAAMSSIGAAISTLTALLGQDGLAASGAGIIAALIGWATTIYVTYFLVRQRNAAWVEDLLSAKWLAALVVVVVVVAPAIKLVGLMAHARFVPADEVGVSMWWTSVGGAIQQGCLLVACMAMILMFRERLSATAGTKWC